MKRSISLVLAILMVASLMTFGSMSVSAEMKTLIALGADGWKAVEIAGNEGGTFDELPDGWKMGEGITWESYTTPIGNVYYGGAFGLFDNGQGGPVQPAIAAVREFEVSNVGAIENLSMYIDFDEDPVVYINGIQVYTDTSWQKKTVDLSEHIGLLKEGKNYLAIEVKQGFGGCGFDLSLEAGTPDLVDENGNVNIKKVASNNTFGGETNVLDKNNGSCCGGWFDANNKQSWTLEFHGDVAVSEIYLQSKTKEEPGLENGCTSEANYTGDATIFGFYSIYVGDTLVATKVPARAAADNGATVKLSAPVTASYVKVVCDEWFSSCWANINEINIKSGTTSTAIAEFEGVQEGENALRFIGSVDSLDCDSVDLQIAVKDGKIYSSSTTTVYKALKGDGGIAIAVNGYEGTAAEKVDAEALYGLALINIPEDTDTTATVAPVAIENEGANGYFMVVGQIKTVEIKN